mmetsp:Transcript_12563/g.18830  ORF Transcript_12563/g.18830 Transcript_12563/m.18830 type:complete len:94 (-) Transcript_12563:1832-2113(-)
MNRYNNEIDMMMIQERQQNNTNNRTTQIIEEEEETYNEIKRSISNKNDIPWEERALFFNEYEDMQQDDEEEEEEEGGGSIEAKISETTGIESL